MRLCLKCCGPLQSLAWQCTCWPHLKNGKQNWTHKDKIESFVYVNMGDLSWIMNAKISFFKFLLCLVMLKCIPWDFPECFSRSHSYDAILLIKNSCTKCKCIQGLSHVVLEVVVVRSEQLFVEINRGRATVTVEDCSFWEILRQLRYCVIGELRYGLQWA